MLLIKLLLSSSSFLLLLLLLTVVAVFTLELRANFIRIIRELFAFLWGWPNITYTPEATLARLAALDLLYFARYLCNFFITIFIIYYCLPLIGYVLIFCFFFELKFKFKFVRRFFFGGGTGSETVSEAGWEDCSELGTERQAHATSSRPQLLARIDCALLF